MFHAWKEDSLKKGVYPIIPPLWTEQMCTSPVSTTAWGLFKLTPQLHNQLLCSNSKSLARWNPVFILCILLSRMPLAGSGVDEWLETNGQMNHAHIRMRRQQICQKYPRVSLWREFLQLSGILCTYGKRTVSNIISVHVIQLTLWVNGITCACIDS